MPIQCNKCKSVFPADEMPVVQEEEVCPYCFSDNWGEPAQAEVTVEYWRRRALRAEEYIRSVPCDPDITDEQKEAWMQWKETI